MVKENKLGHNFNITGFIIGVVSGVLLGLAIGASRNDWFFGVGVGLALGLSFGTIFSTIEDKSFGLRKNKTSDDRSDKHGSVDDELKA